MFNKLMVDELFHKESILIGNRDAVPKYRVVELFGEAATNHGYDKPGTDWNAYGVGGNTLTYLTESGFQKAATYANIVEALEKEKNAKK